VSIGGSSRFTLPGRVYGDRVLQIMRGKTRQESTHKWYVHRVIVSRYQAGKTLQTTIKGHKRVSVKTIEIKSVDMLSRELSKVITIACPSGHRS